MSLCFWLISRLGVCFSVLKIKCFLWNFHNPISLTRKENKIHPGASLGDKAQLSSCYVAAGSDSRDFSKFTKCNLGPREWVVLYKCFPALP